MKRILILTVLFTAVLFINQTQAQRVDTFSHVKDTLTKVSFGVKLGAQFNQIQGSETFQQGYVPGVVGGAYIASTRKKWGVQAEALVSTSRYNLLNDSSNNGAYFSVAYVNIAAMPEYEIMKHIWIQLGLQFSTFISVTRDPAQPLDAKNYFQPKEFSGVAGVEVRLRKNFTAGARYIYGFSNIRNTFDSSTTQSWTTRSAQVYVGYRLD